MTAGSMRLHVTPFSPDLLRAVVGPQLLDQVSNLSYHTIQTFPENSYGYLDLPTMEAERIKKKLNGAILKGKKIKIEEARPPKRRRLEEPTEELPKSESLTEPKKSKTENNVITGHELSSRKIKRGWTEADNLKSGKKGKVKGSSSASKFTDKNELLFRTKLPPNKTESGKKAKSRKSSSALVVHEFERSTTQPSFLRQEDAQRTKGHLEYVDGQGWVDEAGQVVEPESERVLTKREALKRSVDVQRDTRLSSDRSSPTSSSSSEDEAQLANGQDEDQTSSSGSSSDSDSEEDTDDSAADQEGAPSEREPSAPTEVHPLEALFKKPSKPASQDVAEPSLELTTSFSFFEGGADDEGDEWVSMPGTPFTAQDIRSRGLRSAAPTPDTAHPNRFQTYGSSGLLGDEGLEEDDDGPHDDAAGGGLHESREQVLETPSRKQSDFEKKFWQNRGDNNRAWKLRRRNVLKEKRQRENKARRPKNW